MREIKEHTGSGRSFLRRRWASPCLGMCRRGERGGGGVASQKVVLSYLFRRNKTVPNESVGFASNLKTEWSSQLGKPQIPKEDG